jgi:hypothetical protein
MATMTPVLSLPAVQCSRIGLGGASLADARWARIVAYGCVGLVGDVAALKIAW